MTAKELARRICRSERDIGTVLERVRHWTKSGLLHPVERRPGKGNSRLFDESALAEAAVLNALAGISGIPILGRQLLLALAIAREAAGQWTAGDHRQRWLELVWVTSKSFSAKCVPYLHVEALTPQAGTDASVILNLSSIFARVYWEPPDGAETPLHATKRPKRRERK